MKVKLDKLDTKLVNACATKTTRPDRNIFCIRDGEIMATNGFVLAIREADISGPTQEDITIPMNILKSLKPTGPRRKLDSERRIELEPSEDKVKAIYKDGFGKEVGYEITFNQSAAKFISVEKIRKIRNDVPVKKNFQIGLSVEVLKTVLACMPDNGYLKFGFTESNEPIEVECSNMARPISMIIKPVLFDWSDFEWYRNAKKED